MRGALKKLQSSPYIVRFNSRSSIGSSVFRCETREMRSIRQSGKCGQLVGELAVFPGETRSLLVPARNSLAPKNGRALQSQSLFLRDEEPPPCGRVRGARRTDRASWSAAPSKGYHADYCVFAR